jgi:cobalt transporter subunit CbtA
MMSDTPQAFLVTNNLKETNLMVTLILNGMKAGALAGFILGLLNVFFVSPLILEAETYEVASKKMGKHPSLLHWGTSLFVNEAQAHGDTHQTEVAGSSPEEKEFSPDGRLRSTLTVVGSSLIGMSYGVLCSLILVVGIKLKIIDQDVFNNPWKQGLIYGLVAFFVLHGLPSIGLPPPPPGIEGAEGDFPGRQNWWIATVFCGFLAVSSLQILPRMLLRSFSLAPNNSRALATVAAFFFCCIPFFVIGVPEHSTISKVPTALNQSFVAASLGINAVFWVVLSTLLFKFLGPLLKTQRKTQSLV